MDISPKIRILPAVHFHPLHPERRQQLKRFLRWIAVARMAIARVRKTKCPRQRALGILTTQGLAFTGQMWTAVGLQIVKTEHGIVIFLLGEGEQRESLTLDKSDPLVPHLKMKMTIAEKRFALRAA